MLLIDRGQSLSPDSVPVSRLAGPHSGPAGAAGAGCTAVRNGPQRAETVPNGPKRSPAGRNGHQRSGTGRNGHQRSPTGRNGHQRSPMGRNGQRQATARVAKEACRDEVSKYAEDTLVARRLKKKTIA